MAPERTGGRAWRVEQDRIDSAVRLPVERISLNQSPVQMGAIQILAQSLQPRRGRVDCSNGVAGGSDLHGLAARRSAEVEHLPGPVADQPRRERGRQVLNPPATLPELGKL